VFDLAFLVDDDPDRNGIESAVREDWIDFLHDVFVARIVPNARGGITSARPLCETGLVR
jgi:hypothetical protein